MATGKYIIKEDRMGNITINHSLRPGSDVFLQMESDKDLILGLLSKSTRDMLDKGWDVEIKDTVPAASTLDEIWEASATEKKLPPGDVVIQDAGLNYKLVKIYRNGRVFAAHYAEPFPTKESAMRDFFENPKKFEPFDESTGRYVERGNVRHNAGAPPSTRYKNRY